MGQPFKIEPEDIVQLRDFQLTQLLRELLIAEAYKFNIAKRSVSVASNIYVGDGGEDGRISWKEGLAKTDYIPCRLTMFQNKATNMLPNEYATEIMLNEKELKPKVEEIFQQQGYYIIFTTQALNQKQKDIRIKAIRQRLKDLNKKYADICNIEIYDASKISSWTNEFLTTIITVQQWIKKPTERGIKTFKIWNEYEDMTKYPFVHVKSREKIIDTLLKYVAEPKTCYRLVGLSGLGKTRIALHIFKKNLELQNLVIYIDAEQTLNTAGLVSDWVNIDYQGILVVDNCDFVLHDKLEKEVQRSNSKFSLLTLDYNFEKVSSCTTCLKLEPMTDEEMFSFLKPEYEKKMPDIDRISRFAQGFPQIAILLAEARLSEVTPIGELTDDYLLKKLLWGKGQTENFDQLKILQACSLFSCFGIESDGSNHLEYISCISSKNIDDIYECIVDFSKRGIVRRRGRFGQVVPKPLAMRLAGQWWDRTRKEVQLEVVKNIPNSLNESFCVQIENMSFQKGLYDFISYCSSENEYLDNASLLFSEYGSRLFLSFAHINPYATSFLLKRKINSLELLDLLEIRGKTRRNIIWALEILCYHEESFEEAAWSLFRLALAENEELGNNASGIFAKLFRIFKSGAAVNFDIRLNFLRNAIERNNDQSDKVVLDALESAIPFCEVSFAGGARFQGMDLPQKEWEPRIWQEIFQYWEAVFRMLLLLFDRGEYQKNKVLQIIGASIFDLVKYGCFDILDVAIKKIVNINGTHWPEAFRNIKNLINFQIDKLQPDALPFLNQWIELLSPNDTDLLGKLKNIVISPNIGWEKRKDGEFVDVAAEKAKILGSKVAKDINELFPYVLSLSQGDQAKTREFGYQIALDLPEISPLLEISFEQYLIAKPANLSFIFGIFQGIFDESPELWQKEIDLLAKNKRLAHLFPQLIYTGKVQKKHLDQLLELIRSEVCSLENIKLLCYGHITGSLDPVIIMGFCLSLAEIGDEAAWIALDILYMFCLGRKDCFDILRDQIKILVLKVPLQKAQFSRSHDLYEWHEFNERLLEMYDEEFAFILTINIISASQYHLDFIDTRTYLNTILVKLFRIYEKTLWPSVSTMIIQSIGNEYIGLYRLFKGDEYVNYRVESVFSALPIKSIISWCKEYHDKAPLFVAECINIFTANDQDQRRPSELLVALLEEFGEDSEVLQALTLKMNQRSCGGSMIPYLEKDIQTLLPLYEHKNKNVRAWIKREIEILKKKIEDESQRENERDMYMRI